MVDLDLESVIRDSVGPYSEMVVEIDGSQGSWLQKTESSDKALSNVVLIRKSGKLYYIAGSARAFEKIIKGIKFIDKPAKTF